MVTSLNRSNPARDVGYQMVQYISARITIVTAGTDVNVKVGTVPAGSVIIGISSRVATAVTVGTLGIGTTSGGTQVVSAIAETAGSEWLMPLTANAGPFTVDTDIYAGTAGSATAGDVVITVVFVKPLS